MLEQLLYSGKLGDGCLVHRAKTSVIMFSSKCLNYLIHKKIILESNYIKTSSITYGKSGYTGKYNIAKFSSYSDLKIVCSTKQIYPQRLSQMGVHLSRWK